MKGLTLRVTSVTGTVTLNDEPLKGERTLRDGAQIALASGSSCKILLNSHSCADIAEVAGTVRVISHVPPCLHLQTNCCFGRHHYELLTHLGTISVDRQLIPLSACSKTTAAADSPSVV